MPVTGRTDSSPDIIVVPEGVAAANPLEEGGAGVGSLVAGNKYSVLVRVRNRGLQSAADADVKVYWSPVATLVTPGMWNEIKASPAGGAVTVSDRPIWSGAIPWEPPNGGHRCFIATVQDRRDEELTAPPGQRPYFDWRRFSWFMRWHNNVACCNVHRVAAQREVELPFLVTGTPDLARSFDFEIVRNMPHDVTLELDAQAALASQIGRSRLWDTPVNAGRPEQVRLVPPRQPRVLVERVRLIAEAEFPCTFRVGEGTRDGDSLSIRQLYRGREVGRITWRFHG